MTLTDHSVSHGNKRLLSNINLTINDGETVALVGESGAGKSTLLAQFRAAYPEQVAWCPQAPALVPMLSLYHNVYMGRLHQQPLWQNLVNLLKPHPQSLIAIEQLARSLGLLNGDSARLIQAAENFSGGEQQRIGIARALYQQRSIFLGDEPVSAIDERHAPEVIEQIKHRHRTVVLALHDVTLALAHCDRIVGLQQGRIVLDQASSELTRSQLLALYPDERH